MAYKTREVRSKIKCGSILLCSCAKCITHYVPVFSLVVLDNIECISQNDNISVFKFYSNDEDVCVILFCNEMFYVHGIF